VEPKANGRKIDITAGLPKGEDEPKKHGSVNLAKGLSAAPERSRTSIVNLTRGLPQVDAEVSSVETAPLDPAAILASLGVVADSTEAWEAKVESEHKVEDTAKLLNSLGLAPADLGEESWESKKRQNNTDVAVDEAVLIQSLGLNSAADVAEAWEKKAPVI
jgi:hypothetical protein